jgi:HK97 family phage prohead protease
MNRPVSGGVEERTAPDATVDDKRLRGVIPYGVESRDMGGWTEVIDPGALAGAKLDDLVATVDHVGIPIGRYPTTLDLEDRSDGAHWSVQLPESRSDVREAVERGDLRAGSWRMVVSSDEWRGDVRHVKAIAELRDVSIVTAPAYPTAATEYRSTDPAKGQEDTMADQAEQETTTTTTVEDRSAAPTGGGLNVEDRVTVEPARGRGLADEFRAAGFPGETATLSWQDYEDRAITWTGSVDNVNKQTGTAGPLGYDQRYVWPAVPRVGVDGGVTSVDVFTQSARSLATAANVVRAISAVTAKPETGSTLTIVTTPLNQVATVQSGIPNIYLETEGSRPRSRTTCASRCRTVWTSS